MGEAIGALHLVGQSAVAGAGLRRQHPLQQTAGHRRRRFLAEGENLAGGPVLGGQFGRDVLAELGPRAARGQHGVVLAVVGADRHDHAVTGGAADVRDLPGAVLVYAESERMGCGIEIRATMRAFHALVILLGSKRADADNDCCEDTRATGSAATLAAERDAR